MSATVWLPQPAGQPDQWMRMGRPLWIFVSRLRANLKGARLGLDDGEVAELDARAAHQATHDFRRVVTENLEERLGGEVAEARVGHMGDDHVLIGAEAHLARAVGVRQSRQLEDLVTAHAARGNE